MLHKHGLFLAINAHVSNITIITSCKISEVFITLAFVLFIIIYYYYYCWLQFLSVQTQTVSQVQNVLEVCFLF